MRAILCRVFGALCIAVVPVVAVAQAIPSSELPGRERDRFFQPPSPFSQPGGGVISLPSTTAPAGAESVGVFISEIQIVGSTVYSPDQVAPLYPGMVGQQW